MEHSYKEQWALRQAALAAFVAGFGVRADAADPVVAQYRARQDELVNASQTLIDAADAERRELNADERKQIQANSDEVERLENEIELRSRVSAQQSKMNAPQPRKTPVNAGDPDPQGPGATGVQTTHIATPATRAAARGNGGWRNLGDFARAVKAAVLNQGMDGRLQAALSTYGSEGVGADGGFAVPPDYRNTIMSIVQGEDSLFSRTDNMPSESNSVTVPTDETTAWGTSGVRVYSRAEAGAMTQSKPALKDVTVRLNEIYAFVPVTDELLEDAPLLSSFLTTKAGEAIDFKITDYIINGTGAGQPLGILNSGALVTQAAVGSQTAGTIHADNILAMWGRMPARARANAIWLCNQDAEQQLMKLGIGVVPATSTTPVGGMPLYVPPGGLSASPYSTLLGRPIVTTEACAAVGTVGDIILAYMPGYFMPYKAGGIKSDVSMHLYFDQAVTCFRWTLRFGGQPWLSAPIARKNGSNTLSHFVALAAR